MSGTMREIEWRSLDAAVADDRGNQARRGYIERRIEDVDVRRRCLSAEAATYLVGRALLDGNAFTSRRRRVECARRRGDVEWNTVMPRRDRQRVGADLVRDVAIRRDAIGADEAEIDPPRAHEHRGGAVDQHRDADSRASKFPRGETASLQQ